MLIHRATHHSFCTGLELITDKARNLFISRSCSRTVSIGRGISIQYFLNRSSMGKDIAVSIIFALLFVGNASYAVWGCTSWVLNSFTTRVIKKLISRIDTVDATNEPSIDAWYGIIPSCRNWKVTDIIDRE